MLGGLFLAAMAVFASCLVRLAWHGIVETSPSRALVISTIVSALVVLVLVWTAHRWLFGAISVDSPTGWV